MVFQDLLLEGYDSNRLIVVIPFVCKVLEQCNASKVFQPPNPWLMAIMKLLAELYHYAELKLNLKFEVEVLCKNIKLDIKGRFRFVVRETVPYAHKPPDIPPTNLLRERPQKALAGAGDLFRNFAKLSVSGAAAETGTTAGPLGNTSGTAAGALPVTTSAVAQQPVVAAAPGMWELVRF